MTLTDEHLKRLLTIPLSDIPEVRNYEERVRWLGKIVSRTFNIPLDESARIRIANSIRIIAERALEK